MDLEGSIPRRSEEELIGESHARKRTFVPRNNLQELPSLHIPGVGLIGIKRPSEYDFSIRVHLEAGQLAPLIRSKYSEFLLLHNIISIHCPIQAAREEGIRIGEFQPRDGSLVLLQSGDTEVGGGIPETNGALACSSRIHIHRVIGDLLGLVDESPLVQDVALRFPFPYDHLPQRLYPQGKPGA